MVFACSNSCTLVEVFLPWGWRSPNLTSQLLRWESGILWGVIGRGGSLTSPLYILGRVFWLRERLHSVLVSDSKHGLPPVKPNPTLSGCSVPRGAVTKSWEKPFHLQPVGRFQWQGTDHSCRCTDTRFPAGSVFLFQLAHWFSRCLSHLLSVMTWCVTWGKSFPLSGSSPLHLKSGRLGLDHPLKTSHL